MKNLIVTAFGDGTGNTSMMRIIIFMMIAAVIGSKFYNAWLLKAPIVWDTTDLEMAGMAIGGKLIQNTQENKPDSATAPATALAVEAGKPGPTVVGS